MAETTTNQNIQATYINLKTKLAQRNTKITTETPPNTVSATQGSIWGTSPKTAQKKITFTLQQEETGTHIKATSALTSGYIKLTVAGCIFSVALAIVCFWIGWDLTNYASTGKGYWIWLAQTSGPFNRFEPDTAALLIRVTWILTAFLVGTLVAEAVVIAKVRSGINAFAKETLKELD